MQLATYDYFYLLNMVHFINLEPIKFRAIILVVLLAIRTITTAIVNSIIKISLKRLAINFKTWVPKKLI